jgi:predicted branched-subunit amino acid permease
MRAASMLALGPLLFGVSFGLLAETAGMGATAAVIFSATTFAVLLYPLWIAGTAIGTVVGNRLGTPEDYGLRRAPRRRRSRGRGSAPCASL